VFPRPAPAPVAGAGLFDIPAIGMGDFDITGLPDLKRALAGIPAQARAAAGRVLADSTALVFRNAKLNAPRSPTMAQTARRRKTRRDTSKSRSATAATRAKPGGLERSISMTIDRAALTGSVFVSSNSEAGKYAAKIHDEKGVSWQNRGVGTIAKGTRADDKFIERALADNADKITGAFEAALRKVNL